MLLLKGPRSCPRNYVELKTEAGIICPSLSLREIMADKTRICIFVDGENLRYSIIDLFPNFNKNDHLPRNADWSGLFDWITKEAVDEDACRIRTYWYTIQNIEFSPFDLNSAKKDIAKLATVLSKNKVMGATIANTPPEELQSLVVNKADELIKLERWTTKTFNWWTRVHNSIALNHRSIEFRTAGTIRHYLFENEFGSEKAVDVKLATDLILLKDIYDVAIIISGDQDYVPAVDSIKDFGKHVVNVAFEKENGNLLPSGARRLNQSTDWSLAIKHSKLSEFLKI